MTSINDRPGPAREAIGWFVKAANQGLSEAQIELGDALKSGQFTQQDYIEAYKWYVLASKGVTSPFNISLIRARGARDALILRMTQEQIAEGQNGSTPSNHTQRPTKRLRSHPLCSN